MQHSCSPNLTNYLKGKGNVLTLIKCKNLLEGHTTKIFVYKFVQEVLNGTFPFFHIGLKVFKQKNES